jgi:hypothetical protein
MNSSIWQTISISEASARSAYGFGGWLISFYIYALFLLGWHLSSLLGDGSGMLMMFETPDNVARMKVVLILKSLLWLPFLILTPMKNPLMPALTIGCLVAATLIDGITVIFLLDLNSMKVLAINVFNLVVLAVYSAYLIRSKRVNLTYRLRERTA